MKLRRFLLEMSLESMNNDILFQLNIVWQLFLYHCNNLSEREAMWCKDGKTRCRWANPANVKYIRYYDEEWGVPEYDDHKLFELLALESFQAGLSWECVLNKRESFCRAFDDFDLEKVCSYNEAHVENLMMNLDIIRNRLKTQAAILNARIFHKIQQEWGSFSDYIWHWTDGKVIYEKGLPHSELSDRVSKDLKKRGMKFVGTTIIYSYLQAIGVIYSHAEGCFLEKGI